MLDRIDFYVLVSRSIFFIFLNLNACTLCNCCHAETAETFLLRLYLSNILIFKTNLNFFEDSVWFQLNSVINCNVAFVLVAFAKQAPTDQNRHKQTHVCHHHYRLIGSWQYRTSHTDTHTYYFPADYCVRSAVRVCVSLLGTVFTNNTTQQKTTPQRERKKETPTHAHSDCGDWLAGWLTDWLLTVHWCYRCCTSAAAAVIQRQHQQQQTTGVAVNLTVDTLTDCSAFCLFEAVLLLLRWLCWWWLEFRSDELMRRKLLLLLHLLDLCYLLPLWSSAVIHCLLCSLFCSVLLVLIYV